VRAFEIPGTLKHAALPVKLAPGSYTAHVSGVNRLTGSALVDIYGLL